MENASKALIMAGGMLIALMIMALMVNTYQKKQNLFNQQQTQIQTQQLIAFNKEFESYNKKLLRGVEVVSLINRAISNNVKYENDKNYEIKIDFIIKEQADSLAPGNYNIEYYNKNIKDNSTAFTDLKRKIFKCSDLKYSSTSGRVNYMKFEEIEV